jgi:hypothetical protein
MAKDKNSFILYCDLINVVSKLPDDKAGQLFKHILAYVNDQNPETDDLLLSVVFEPIKSALKRDLNQWELSRNKRSESGKSGMAKRWKVITNDNGVINPITNDNSVITDITKITVSDNVSVSVNVNDINIYKIEDCKKIALKDDKWVNLNKTNDQELTRFNEYLHKQSIYELNPAEYKRYFHHLKEKKPDKVKQKLTIEDYRRMAKEQDEKNNQ